MTRSSTLLFLALCLINPFAAMAVIYAAIHINPLFFLGLIVPAGIWRTAWRLAEIEAQSVGVQ